jgi:hypothetical protein
VQVLCFITHERRRQRAAHTLAHPHILTGLTPDGTWYYNMCMVSMYEPCYAETT